VGQPILAAAGFSAGVYRCDNLRIGVKEPAVGRSTHAGRDHTD